ncbi:MAG: response regulator [Promethearchaeota archaeon]
MPSKIPETPIEKNGNEPEDMDLIKIDSNSIEKTEEMKRYEEETNRYSIWRGVVTEGFKKWQRGEKIYHREKERISLYVSDDMKAKWLEYSKSDGTTISKLIREAVDAFIQNHGTHRGNKLSTLDPKTISNISHTLKEPLTSIKGYSQLLIENYREKLNEQVLDTVKNIFEQSILLEKKIINILDNIKTEPEHEVLLIEDDLATIRLIKSYFESKGYKCKGVVSGSKGLEELGNSIPSLILLDIILPDLNGYDICKTIKSDKEYKNIPVYFLTAIAGSEVEKNLEETKADGYILKPFNFADFEVIFKILEENRKNLK